MAKQWNRNPAKGRAALTPERRAEIARLGGIARQAKARKSAADDTPEDAPMTPYQLEKKAFLERQRAKLDAAAERLTRIEQQGSPYRRRTDPLRKTGAIHQQYDPADALWRSLQPYHGEQKPR